MRTTLRKIGNSKGIIIPKSFIDANNISSEVEMIVTENSIIIESPVKGVRENWKEKFERAIKAGELPESGSDLTIIETEYDNEWTWPEGR